MGRFKVVILGEGRVGKTSILLRFVRNEYSDAQETTLQASYLLKKVDTSDGDSAELSIWDTAGQERFHALGPIYYRDADGALLVYDITSHESFVKVRTWVRELQTICGNDISITIAGNKKDLESKRVVKEEEALEYAKTVGATHIYTSAKTNTGLKEVFTELATKMNQRRKELSGGSRGGKSGGPNKLTFVDDARASEVKKKKGGCC